MHLYGGAQQVLYLVSGLASRGIHNTVICPQGSAIATVLGKGDGDLLEVPMTGDGDFGFIWRCRRLLKNLQPDLLHVHSRRGADIYGGLAARGAQVPAVITRRVDNPERQPWAGLKYGNYRAVIAISACIRDLLIRGLGLPPQRVHLVPSAVDGVRFQPAPARDRVLSALTLPADSFLIAVVAQLIDRKGHRVLLDALEPLVSAHPMLRVLLFGQGPLAGKLARLIKRLGLEQQVKLVGFRHDLAELLPGMDLVVHPALTEGLGVALLEALASGVAVIASDVGGIPDLIEDGIQGRLVAAGDKIALAESLADLIQDEPGRQRMGAAGRQRALESFSIDRMVDGNLDVYRQVLE